MATSLWGVFRRLYSTLRGNATFFHYPAQCRNHLRDVQLLVDGEAEKRSFVYGVNVPAPYPALRDEAILLQIAHDLVNSAFGEVGPTGDLPQGSAWVLKEMGEHKPVVAQEVPFLRHYSPPMRSAETIRRRYRHAQG